MTIFYTISHKFQRRPDKKPSPLYVVCVADIYSPWVSYLCSFMNDCSPFPGTNKVIVLRLCIIRWNIFCQGLSQNFGKKGVKIYWGFKQTNLVPISILQRAIHWKMRKLLMGHLGQDQAQPRQTANIHVKTILFTCFRCLICIWDKEYL